jgi:hypothetical protein
MLIFSFFLSNKIKAILNDEVKITAKYVNIINGTKSNGIGLNKNIP